MDLLQALGIIVGVVSGVSGLVLGILSQIHQRETTRPRLRVRPRVLHLVDRSPELGEDESERNVGVIEVCNVGHIPVVGSTVGFLPRRKGQMGQLVVSPRSLDGGRWTDELPPGRAVLLRMDLRGLVAPMKRKELGRAYAATMIGDTFKASRGDMRVFTKELERAAGDLGEAS